MLRVQRISLCSKSSAYMTDENIAAAHTPSAHFLHSALALESEVEKNVLVVAVFFI